MAADNVALTFTPTKILVIAMRQLGDVLLVTPLLHSLRQAYPQARLDVLVYEGTTGMLAGNPDIDQILTTPQRPHATDVFQLISGLFRQYDLAVSTQTGDRPILYACLASAFRIAPVPPVLDKGRWKRWFVQRWLEFDDEHTHTVLQNLRLLSLIAIPQYMQLIAPRVNDASILRQRFSFLLSEQDYVVLHPHPMWRYKRWHLEGWQALVEYFIAREVKVVLSGSGSLHEVEYIKRIAGEHQEQVVNLAGQVSLAELAFIIAGAKIFIGPDTGVTHLAAATGVKTIALFGPTNPVKWAPWPYGYHLKSNPFMKEGCQQLNNVVLLQGKSESGCVPCHKEGCDRHQFSKSHCLETLAVDLVVSVVEPSLAASTAQT